MGGLGVGFKGHGAQSGGSATGPIPGDQIIPPLILEDPPAPDYLALEVLNSADAASALVVTSDGVFNFGDRLVGWETPYGYQQARVGRMTHRWAGSFLMWANGTGVLGPQAASATPPTLVADRPSPINKRGSPKYALQFTKADETSVTYQMDPGAATVPLPSLASPYYGDGLPSDKLYAFWFKADSLPTGAGEKAYLFYAHDPAVADQYVSLYLESDGGGNVDLIYVEKPAFLISTNVAVTNWNPNPGTWYYITIQPDPSAGPIITGSAAIWIGTSFTATNQANAGFGLSKVSGLQQMILGNSNLGTEGLDGRIYDLSIYDGYMVPNIDEGIYVPQTWDGRGLLGNDWHIPVNGLWFPSDVRYPEKDRSSSIYAKGIAANENVQLGRFSHARIKQIWFTASTAVPADALNFWILTLWGNDGTTLLQSVAFNTSATALPVDTPVALNVDQNQLLGNDDSIKCVVTVGAGLPAPLGGSFTVEWNDKQL